MFPLTSSPSTEAASLNESLTTEIVTDVGLISLSHSDHARLAELVVGRLDPDHGQAFYHSVVERNARFPVAWERLILRGHIASLPDREDLRARLEVVEALHVEVLREERVAEANPMQHHAVVRTSKGPVGLSRDEHTVLLNLMAGRSSHGEAQTFYGSLTSRQVAFPPEWELLVIRATVKAYPERDDLLARMAELEEALGSTSEPADAAHRMAFHRAWARFARADLNADGPIEEKRTRRKVAFNDAFSLLVSPVFADQPAERRVEIIVALHNTLMSVPSADLPAVAELGMRRFRELLDEPGLTEQQACTVFDCVHSLYFAGVADTQELRRFDTVVPPFEAWLEARFGRHERPPTHGLTDGRMTIAYLLHTGHFQRGNAVAPLVVSMAEMHAARSDRRILLYLVQHVAADLVERVKQRGIEVRVFEQGMRYDRNDEIADALKEDEGRRCRYGAESRHSGCPVRTQGRKAAVVAGYRLSLLASAGA